MRCTPSSLELVSVPEPPGFNNTPQDVCPFLTFFALCRLTTRCFATWLLPLLRSRPRSNSRRHVSWNRSIPLVPIPPLFRRRTLVAMAPSMQRSPLPTTHHRNRVCARFLLSVPNHFTIHRCRDQKLDDDTRPPARYTVVESRN